MSLFITTTTTATPIKVDEVPLHLLHLLHPLTWCLLHLLVAGRREDERQLGDPVGQPAEDVHRDHRQHQSGHLGGDQTDRQTERLYVLGGRRQQPHCCWTSWSSVHPHNQKKKKKRGPTNVASVHLVMGCP